MSVEIVGKSAERNTGGRIAFLIVLAIVLLAGAYLSNELYENSPGGIGSLVGELIGVWFVFGAITLFSRKGYTAAIVLAFAAIGVAVGNVEKLQKVWDAKVVARAAGNPQQLAEAVSQNPENKLLKVFAMANKFEEEMTAASTKLSNEIEPATLNKDIDYVTASRGDLDALLRDLKTAEANVTAYSPRVLALVAAERAKIVAYASTVDVDKATFDGFLRGFDEASARNSAFGLKMMTVRAELYRAYENLVSILIEEFGNYKVVANGQFIFSKQATVDRYNAAFNALNAAAQRVGALEIERKQLEQATKDRRDQLAKGK